MQSTMKLLFKRNCAVSMPTLQDRLYLGLRCSSMGQEKGAAWLSQVSVLSLPRSSQRWLLQHRFGECPPSTGHDICYHSTKSHQGWWPSSRDSQSNRRRMCYLHPCTLLGQKPGDKQEQVPPHSSLWLKPWGLHSYGSQCTLITHTQTTGDF